MSKIDISVIIPIYNAEKYLEHCVKSIVENDDSFAIEIILVNDGSEDKSGQICNKLCEDYPVIKVKHQENKGVSCARNMGLSMAEGKYIMFVDADDEVTGDGLKILFQRAKETEAELIFADIMKVDYNGEVIRKTWDESSRSYEGVELETALLAYLGDPRGYNLLSFVWNKLFVREIICLHQICFNENLKINEDALFVFEYMRYVSKMDYIRKYTYYYYTNRDNIGTNHMEEDPYAYEKSLTVIYQRLKNNPLLYKKAEQYYYHAFVELAIRNMFHIVRCHQGDEHKLYMIISNMLRHETLHLGLKNYKSKSRDNFKIVPFLVYMRQSVLLIWIFRLQIYLKNVGLRR